MPKPSSTYYPFSSKLPTRSWRDASRAYKFGFDTQEKDFETANEVNSYTAEIWQYEGRLGRRWNIVSIMKVYERTFACFNNIPIDVIDPKGGERLSPNLSNHRSKDIFFKPENTGESKKIDSNKDLYSKIDAVAAPRIKSKQVFKVFDRFRVTVTDHKLNWKGDHWGYSTMQVVRGCCKGESWLDKLTATYIIYRHFSWKTGSSSDVKVKNNTDFGWVEIFESFGTEKDKFRKQHDFIEYSYGW